MIAAALLLAASVASCRAEYCARTKDVTACKCYGTEDASYSLRIRRGAKMLYDEKQDVVNFENDTIEVHRLDLDADGAPEIVVADFAGMSNGLGVRYWNLVVLDGRTAKASAMKAQDYGKGSFRREKDGRYTILETSWDWMGPALYFVARPYQYEHGALMPQKTRGMWRRRFLFSFERERSKGGGPGQWLKKAEKVKWVSRDALQ